MAQVPLREGSLRKPDVSVGRRGCLIGYTLPMINGNHSNCSALGDLNEIPGLQPCNLANLQSRAVCLTVPPRDRSAEG